MSSVGTQVDETQLVGVLVGLLGRGQRLLVATEAIEEHRARPLDSNKPEPLAAAHHLMPAGIDQRQGLHFAASPSGQGDRALRREVAAARLDDGLRLDHERLGRRKVADEQLHAEALDQRNGQLRKGPGGTG